MPRSTTPSNAENYNPRWHLVNLLPLWILQALTSTLITYLLFHCFFYCPPTYTLIHYTAMALCAISHAIIASEAHSFAARTLTPLRSMVLQGVKMALVGTQWIVLCVYGAQGTEESKEWIGTPRMSVLVAVLSLPMSVHFGYAVFAHLRRGGGMDREEAEARELETLVGGEDDGILVGKLGDEDRLGGILLDGRLAWPPRRKLLMNWVLQLTYVPVLCFVRYMGPTSPLGQLSTIGGFLTYSITVLLLGLVCYGIWYSFRREGQRLSLRRYLHLQIVKVGLAYFMFGIVILAHRGWQLDVENWVRSLFALFVLSILFGTPYIIECILAISEYKRSR